MDNYLDMLYNSILVEIVYPINNYMVYKLGITSIVKYISIILLLLVISTFWGLHVDDIQKKIKEKDDK